MIGTRRPRWHPRTLRRWQPQLERLEGREVPTTFFVTTPEDGGDGSLRQAILDANANPGDDDIVLPAGTYTLSLTGTDDTGEQGDLDILDNVFLQGEGAETTVIQTTLPDRLIHVHANVWAGLDGVTLRGGRMNGGAGLRQEAGSALLLSHCVVRDNLATAPESPTQFATGGGLLVHGGYAEIRFTAFADNRVVGPNGTVNSRTGSSAQGGGIAVTAGGWVSIHSSLLLGNQALGGNGHGASGAAGNGGQARGGAIAVESGTVQVEGSSIENNLARGGAGGSGGSGGQPGGRGGDASGGALALLVGEAGIFRTDFQGNRAAGGTGGIGGSGGGAGGDGGAASGGVLTIENGGVLLDTVTLAGSQAMAGNGGSGGFNTAGNGGPGGRGGAASGGVLSLLAGRAEILHTHFQGSHTRGGTGGNGGGSEFRTPGRGGDGGAAMGGALCIQGGSAMLNTVTLAESQAVAGSGGHAGGSAFPMGQTGGTGGTARGGALHVSTTEDVVVLDAIVGDSLARGGDGGRGRVSGGGGGGHAFGGALSLDDGNLLLERSSVVSSRALGGNGAELSSSRGPAGNATGGGIWIGGGRATLLENIVTGNAASGGAGVTEGEGRGGGIAIAEKAYACGRDNVIQDNLASTSDDDVFGVLEPC